MHGIFFIPRVHCIYKYVRNRRASHLSLAILLENLHRMKKVNKRRRHPIPPPDVVASVIPRLLLLQATLCLARAKLLVPPDVPTDILQVCPFLCLFNFKSSLRTKDHTKPQRPSFTNSKKEHNDPQLTHFRFLLNLTPQCPQRCPRMPLVVGRHSAGICH